MGGSLETSISLENLQSRSNSRFFFDLWALWAPFQECNPPLRVRRIGLCRNVSPVNTEYDWAKVPPYNGNDPHFIPIKQSIENKGMPGVRARYDAELPPFTSIVRCPSRPVVYWAWIQGSLFHTFLRIFPGISLEDFFFFVLGSLFPFPTNK